MPVQAIQSQTINQPYPVLDRGQTLVSKRDIENYYKNTIAPCLIEPPLQVTNKWEVPLSRPELSKPNPDAKVNTSINEELAHLILDIEKKGASTQGDEKQESDADDNLREAQLHKDHIEALKMQRENHETGQVLAAQDVKQHQKNKKLLIQEYNKEQEELIERQKKSEVLGWLQWIFLGVLILAGIASIVATVATAGGASGVTGAIFAGIATAAKAVGGLAGIASGAATIGKGVLDYQNDQTRKILTGNKEERDQTDIKTKAVIEEVTRTQEIVSECIEEHIEAEKKRKETMNDMLNS